MTKILITNDDGYNVEGITRLADEMRSIGEVIVFAPNRARSGMSAAITSTLPITYKLHTQRDGLTVYSCSGTPVDCVKLALNEVLDTKPDILLSGINHGGNHALSVHYSGTMGAAFEGCVFDVLSIGVSLFDCLPHSNFSEACRIARLVVVEVLKRGLPHGVYLNLNIPAVEHVKGISAARQTDGKWINEFTRDIAIDGSVSFMLGGEYSPATPTASNHVGGFPQNATLTDDLTLLQSGYATVVPCKVDVTDYPFAQELSQWF
ncbi:MAG: 5'/3'-nucleotidase SurE [Tannerella sp.]|jgi:5'-nucleotidase|nr:5'/3'-nucleotidase SurE [Tannerella sp.]